MSAESANAVFTDLEEKQLKVESALSRCNQQELQLIAQGLDENKEDMSALSRIQAIRKIRDCFDGEEDPTKRGPMFLQLIPLVPGRMASSIADILIKGQEQESAEEGGSSGADQLNKSMLDVMKTTSFRKEFKVEGKIGKSKEHIDMISLKGQIAEGKRKGYSDEEVAAAVKRAVVPGEMKTYLDSMTDLALGEIMTFIGSVLKEKSSTDLFQGLTSIIQREGEDPQTFLMKAMELRQKCLIVSKKPGEIPYQSDLVQTVFLRSVRMGLSSDAIKGRFEAVISRDESIDDSSLIQELNKIALEETEREHKLGLLPVSRKVVKFGAVDTYSPTSGTVPPRQNKESEKGYQSTQDLQKTVSQLAEQMTVLTQEMVKLKKTKGTARPKSQLRRTCESCASSNQQAACRHCWQCGESGHMFRDCQKTSN